MHIINWSITHSIYSVHTTIPYLVKTFINNILLYDPNVIGKASGPDQWGKIAKRVVTRKQVCFGKRRKLQLR